MSFTKIIITTVGMIIIILIRTAATKTRITITIMVAMRKNRCAMSKAQLMPT